jgi:predicted dehydrogenase
MNVNLKTADGCRVAIVGAGNMAAEHARALQNVPGVELAGIYSRTRERAGKLAERFGIAEVADSIADLHHRTGAALVVVAVSELSARSVIEECFQFPWTCLIEKPAGYDVAEAEILAEAAAVKGRRAFVALNRRHYASTLAVIDDLADDADPRFIHVQDQEDPRAALAAGRPKRVVDHWMFANSIHIVDYVRMLGRGRVVDVDHVVRWDPDTPGVVVAKIGFESGDVALYQGMWNRPGPWAVAVTTSRKRWEMRPLEQATLQPYGQRTATPAAGHEWDTQFKPGLRRQAELAVRAARGEIVHNLPTMNDALETMRLTRDIYFPGSR